MKQVVLGRCWSNFQDVVGIYWSATAPAPSEHLFWARVRKKCLHVSLSQVPHKFHEIMHRRRNTVDPVKQNFSKCCFDLWHQPIGNGRRYCKIQYNDTGTGSYPLPVEVPSPVLLGVGARSRCRCSRHSESSIHQPEDATLRPNHYSKPLCHLPLHHFQRLHRSSPFLTPQYTSSLNAFSGIGFWQWQARTSHNS